MQFYIFNMIFQPLQILKFPIRLKFTYHVYIKRMRSTTVNNNAVTLSYSVFQPKKPAEPSSPPIIILHGLLGSRQNWRSLAKAIAIKTEKQVYTLDARNHGDSPHSENFDYPIMALDLREFMVTKKISSAILIGHSMGGRTVMTLSLMEPELVNKLVVVDVSPITMPPSSSDIPHFITAMKEAISTISADEGIIQARKIIDKHISKTVPEPDVRMFLLTNLIEIDGIVTWKPNLDVLLNSFDTGIMSFPSISSVFPGKTLFLCGGSSNYVKAEDYPFIRKLFPKAEFMVIDGAGHWVHSEKPSEFLQALYKFLT